MADRRGVRRVASIAGHLGNRELVEQFEDRFVHPAQRLAHGAVFRLIAAAVLGEAVRQDHRAVDGANHFERADLLRPLRRVCSRRSFPAPIAAVPVLVSFCRTLASSGTGCRRPRCPSCSPSPARPGAPGAAGRSGRSPLFWSASAYYLRLFGSDINILPDLYTGQLVKLRPVASHSDNAGG